jgi:hypothetical protein
MAKDCRQLRFADEDNSTRCDLAAIVDSCCAPPRTDSFSLSLHEVAAVVDDDTAN